MTDIFSISEHKLFSLWCIIQKTWFKSSYLANVSWFKGIVHPKNGDYHNLLTLNPAVEHKRIYFKKISNKCELTWYCIVLHGIFFSTMEVNGYRQLFGDPHSSKHLLLCSTEERHSQRFGTTWGLSFHFWVNDKYLKYWAFFFFYLYKCKAMFDIKTISIYC